MRLIGGWLGLGLRPWIRSSSARTLNSSEAYAVWAESYPPHAHNPVMEAEQSVVAPMIAAARPRRALDVGTGTGRNLCLLEAAGARLAVGVDLSMAMLLRRTPSARAVCGDGCRLPFPNTSFDLVCASLMVGDVADLPAWAAEAARVLMPGGHLIYSDFHPAWAQQGWRRTFKTVDGRLFEVSYVSRTIEEHVRCVQRAGLSVRHVREPRLTVRASPVVAVFHAVKGGIAPRPGDVTPR